MANLFRASSRKPAPAVTVRKRQEVPNKPWYNEDKTLFGWIEKSPRGEDNLILSMHSCARLARENCNRILTDEIRSYFVN